MYFRSIVFALAASPLVALADTHVFDGNYSVAIGPGPMTDLYILSVQGSKGALRFAKALQQPSSPDPVKIEQSANKMTVALASNERQKLIFEKSSKGLTCISGCDKYLTSWERMKTAEEIEATNVDPAAEINFDALPVVDIGNIDGAWIQSDGNLENDINIAFEINGELVKRHYFLFGFYQKNNTEAFKISRQFFVSPNSSKKLFELRKISDTKLVVRSTQSSKQHFLYRADSINFADLKKALVAGDPRISP